MRMRLSLWLGALSLWISAPGAWAANSKGPDQLLFESLTSETAFDRPAFVGALGAGANPNLALCYLNMDTARWQPAYGDQCVATGYVFRPLWAVAVGGADRSRKGDIPWSDRGSLIELLVERGAKTSDPFESKEQDGIRFTPLDAFVWDELPSDGADPWTPTLKKLIDSGWKSGFSEMVLTLDRMRSLPAPRPGKVAVFRRVAKELGRASEMEKAIERYCASFSDRAGASPCPTREESLSPPARRVASNQVGRLSDNASRTLEMLSKMDAAISRKNFLEANLTCRSWLGGPKWVPQFCRAFVAHRFRAPDEKEMFQLAWASFKQSPEAHSGRNAELSSIDQQLASESTVATELAFKLMRSSMIDVK